MFRPALLTRRRLWMVVTVSGLLCLLFLLHPGSENGARADDGTPTPTSSPSASPSATPTAGPSEASPSATPAATVSPTADSTTPATTTPAAPAPPTAAQTTSPSAGGADVAPGDVVTGTVVRAWQDGKDDEALAVHGLQSGNDKPLTWIETKDGSVRVLTDQLAAVPVGAKVTVALGAQVADAASADGLEPAFQVAATQSAVAPAAPATSATVSPITNQVTVVMAVPAGGTRDSTTLSQVESAVDGPVRQFWSDQSGGTIQVGVVGGVNWVTLSAGCSDPTTLWNQAAAAAGWTPGPGKHLLVYLSSQPANLAGCSYGLGEVGSGIGDGGRVYVRDTVTSLIAHELGHNFGLGHSSGLQCDGTIDSGMCQLTPYRDYYDVMGASWNQVGSLNAVQAYDLGVLPDAQRQDVLTGSAGGDYTLSPLSATSGTRAIRITAADGDVYFVELREPSGADSWLSGSANVFGLDPGVTIRLQYVQPNTSLLLDGTPSSQAGWDGDLQDAVPVDHGETIAGGEWTVRVSAVSATSATVSVHHETPITIRWLDGGGASGPLGDATAAEVCGQPGGGCYRTFQNGNLYWSPTTGVHEVHGDVLAAWTAAGGVGGPLGWPTTDLVPLTGGQGQAFQGGSAYSSTATGAHTVRGAIRAEWWARGGITGPLGYPSGEPTTVGAGTMQTFSGGTLYSSTASGTHLLSGDIATDFESAGGAAGPLGFPTTDIVSLPGGTGAAFQGGSIYASPGTGAHVVRGAARSAWWATGGVSGPLGYPTSDYAAVAGGFGIAFQRGSVYESPATGAHFLTSAFSAAWVAAGGVTGSFGFPTTDVVPVPGGTGQAFQGGSIYSSAAAGTHSVAGGIRSAWWGTGGVSGPFGFPITDVVTVPGGTAAAFQGGSVYASASSGAHTVAGAIRSAWWGNGGVSGSLGFPTSEPQAVPGGTAQTFTGGGVYWSAAAGAHALSTDFVAAWQQVGGPAGPFGLPFTDVVSVPGGTAAAFQGGSVYSSAGTGAVAVGGAIRSAWWGTGGVSGPLGFPSAAPRAVGSGVGQAFSGGSIYWSAATGAHTVSPDFEAAWQRVGGASGPLGLPITDLVPLQGGTGQAFAGGSVYAASGQSPYAMYGPTRSAWWAAGGISGSLGYPTSDTTAVGSGSSTRFSAGMLAGGAGGAFWIRSAYLDAVNRAGGLGVVGLPITAEVAVPGGTGQAFQSASIYWNSATDGSGNPRFVPHVVSGPLRSAWWAGGGVSGPHGFPTSDVTGVTGSTGAGQSLQFADGTLYWSATTSSHFVESVVDSVYQSDGGPASSYGWPTDDTFDDNGQRANDFQGGRLAG